MEKPVKETGKINYVEMPSRDLEATKRFFGDAFGWSFIDYGPEYVAIQNAGLDGGFFKSDHVATTGNGSVLVVLYSADLEATLDNVKLSGGTIVQDIFTFPGGRRFHFNDPNGNEYAVWSELNA
ncbi:MAG: putative enzyme related to lactoylglutathione lyase [Marinobacter maritimus]|jgi:predicted enzyme related to lactoylglutathione lyase|nr:VOC family protein [Oceanospirillales bacterium]